jgi:antitoxin VapB
MRTASLFKNGKNQAVRLPKEFEFDGVTEVEITRDGESLVLTPKRKSWASFSEVEKADDDFLADRQDVMEEGRVEL